ncbi:MAG TPA: PepSY-associated TM helix domain-containing protein [bacterium]|jgi:uncharacterized iron-regulated membrane protein|nr:PepSY-associated TM helix domain-containing protein [bacterium]
MKLRPFFFWFHLSVGLTTGLVIYFLAFTGFLLSFEPQIISLAERSLKRVSVPAPDAKSLSLDELNMKVHALEPDQQVTGLTINKNPNASVLVNVGRDEVLYINPYTGELLGQGTQLRLFFNTVTELHRWFGFQGPDREAVKTVKGIFTILFGISLISGFYLWWPRQWTVSVFKVIGIPTLRFKGKQREFNWHNAIGFWSAPWLFLIVLTGIIMIYPWANDLLYRATGNEPPARSAMAPPSPDAKGSRGDKKIARKTHSRSANFSAYFAAAEKRSPAWLSMNLRLPQGNRPNVMVVIEEPSSPNAYGRSLLTLDANTAEVIKWEPYEGYNLGRKLRIWVRALHTGEAGGVFGQIIAALAVLGAMVSVFTGFNLSFRRFFLK